MLSGTCQGLHFQSLQHAQSRILVRFTGCGRLPDREKRCRGRGLREMGSSLPISGEQAPELRELENRVCIHRQEPSAEAQCLDRGRCEHLAASR